MVQLAYVVVKIVLVALHVVQPSTDFVELVPIELRSA